jgi:hypothetical protein
MTAAMRRALRTPPSPVASASTAAAMAWSNRLDLLLRSQETAV